MSEQITRELKSHSEGQFDRLNIELSSVMKENFDSMLESASNRMSLEKRTDSSDINEAKAAFTKFIDNVYTLREKRPGQKDIVKFSALNESKKGICPLWPIC